MTGRKVRSRRMAQLDRMGFPEIAKLYVCEAGSVRRLCEMLFEPRSEDEQSGVAAFYSWLKKRKYEAGWRLAVRLRNEKVKEAEVVMPAGFNWDEWAFDAHMNAAFTRANEKESES